MKKQIKKNVKKNTFVVRNLFADGVHLLTLKLFQNVNTMFKQTHERKTVIYEQIFQTLF